MTSRVPFTGLLRRALAIQVRRVFHDQSKGEGPVPASDNALIPQGSVAWRVHGDVTTMMIGGISGLLLQMLHPQALAGVWDHSNFRQDMLGRLRRTARFIAVTTYGERSDAVALIARVRSIHSQVHGIMPDGRTYSADDPRLLSWVHVAGEISFLDAWIRFRDPAMSEFDQDRFFAEVAGVAERLGADPVPRSRREAEALIGSFLPELEVSERTRIIRDHILHPPGTALATLPIQQLLSRAAADLLPEWAREMHGLQGSGRARPAVDGSAKALARILQWALRRD